VAKPVIFNLDDFCQDSMTYRRWKILNDIKAKYPDFRVTMFTIPMRCSWKWLRMVKFDYPWIENAVHGTDHSIQDTYLRGGAARRISEVYDPEFYVKGFKAPKWLVGEESYNDLRRCGFWVATNKSHVFTSDHDSLNYRYDSGKELIKDTLYDNKDFISFHGHITESPNGIENLEQMILDMWESDQQFKFISEVMGED
jgi:hypothetical protein